MNNKLAISLLWSVTLIMTIMAEETPVSFNFCAYYTHIDSGEPFETQARVSEHSDIMVKLGDMQFIFWRASSYLPHLKVGGEREYVREEITRKGDGSGIMPDRVNAFSRVKIVEANQEIIVVHWRYEPDFGLSEFPVKHTNVSADGFVDEYFEIMRDGKVTRTIRPGTGKIEEWKRGANTIIQTFTLTQTGIKEYVTRRKKPEEVEPTKIETNPVLGPPLFEPVACWNFDEAKGEGVKELYSGLKSEVPGDTVYWKKGVSGAALQSDGYQTQLILPAKRTPTISNEITLEAWVALAAYPWNVVPLVQQGDDEGYLLGINAYGYPCFGLMVDGTFHLLSPRSTRESDKDIIKKRGLYKGNLDLFKWYHLSGTYDGSIMRLYVNGNEVASKAVKGQIITVNEPIKLLQGKPRYLELNVRKNFVNTYSLDGLVDEVRIYDRAMMDQNVKRSFQRFDPGEPIRSRPDMQTRSLPNIPTSGRFRAYYENISLYETHDNFWRHGDHSDVIVEFDQSPNKFVFWKGTGYIPMLVNEKNQWYSNEFNETWNKSGGFSCMEPMSDKDNYTNHARIIEQSPARIVIHWRYPLIDIFRVYANYVPDTGWADWADWYYTIYPNGLAYKKMRLWSSGVLNHEFQEAMVISGPGQHPEDIVSDDRTYTLARLDGSSQTYDWTNGPPKPNYRGENWKLFSINYHSDWDPFTIADINNGDVYSSERTPYSVYPSWNHWPVARVESDGRKALAPDRTAHSSINHIWIPVHGRPKRGAAPYYEKVLVEGMTRSLTDDNLDELCVYAKSWTQPAPIKVILGGTSVGYDKTEGAYPLNMNASTLQFTIQASEEFPLIDPCFVINNWGSSETANTIKIGEHTPADIRQGVVMDHTGNHRLVIWCSLKTTEALSCSISSSKRPWREPVLPFDGPMPPLENPEGPGKNRKPSRNNDT